MQDSIITILVEGNSKTIKVKRQPNIWLDYSKLKLFNKIGALTDIKEGLLLEMKYVHNKPDQLVECMVFTLIFLSAFSRAAVHIIPTTACLLATYAPKPLNPFIPATEEAIITLPLSDIWGITYWHPNQTPFRFIAMI